jgi:hypothetical protein
MANLYDFSSVLQVTFGINALLYVFDVLPRQEKSHRDQMRQLDDTWREARVPRERWFAGMFFILGEEELHSFGVRAMMWITCLNSVISLGMLIAAAYAKTLSLPGWMMAVLLAWLVAPALVLHSIAIRGKHDDHLSGVLRNVLHGSPDEGAEPPPTADKDCGDAQ